MPAGYYLSLFDEFPNVTEANLQSRDVDFIHLFTKNQSELKKYFAAAKKALAKTGLLWIPGPRKALKLKQTLMEVLFGISDWKVV